MLLPFDHVWIGDLEFIILFPKEQAHVEDIRCRTWHALDMHMNKVTIQERDMIKIPSQCTRDGEWIYKPIFYREKITNDHFERCEIFNLDASEPKVNGQYKEDGRVWNWDLCSMTVYSGSEKWNLRVMTCGGVWL